MDGPGGTDLQVTYDFNSPVYPDSYIGGTPLTYTYTDTTGVPNIKLPEKSMINPIDSTANSLLDSMRKSRDLAAQYSEALNDEAFQLELAAQSKRALSAYMTNEINEGVPVPADEVLDATTTVRKASK